MCKHAMKLLAAYYKEYKFVDELDLRPGESDRMNVQVFQNCKGERFFVGDRGFNVEGLEYFFPWEFFFSKPRKEEKEIDKERRKKRTTELKKVWKDFNEHKKLRSVFLNIVVH